MRSPEAAPLVGFGATPQPFHGRPVMPNALNPAALVAGSAASLPVTLRFRRRAPKLLSPQLTHCRARWARPTSIGRSRFLSVLVFFVAGRFRLCGGEEGALRSPPPPLRSAHPCCLISIVAEGFRIHPCKSNAQILPHSKSRRVLPAAAFVIHRTSTFRALIPHPCSRRLPAPFSLPPLHRRGGRSTS